MARLTAALVICAILAPAPSSARRRARVDKRPTVAVLYFDHIGSDKKLAVLRKGIAEMLVSDLTSMSGVRIVERERLEQLLKELKLSSSRNIDKRTANKIGKVLGARYMVLGSYFQLGKLCVMAKVVRVETTQVVSSARACGSPDGFIGIQQQMTVKLRTVLATKLKPFLAKRRRTRRKVKRAAVKPPRRLTTKTALRYALALDAKDRGDLNKARAELKKVVKVQPDFRLAARALANLARKTLAPAK